MRDWLKSNGTSVAIESTGVYWKPVFNILEEYFEIILVNASHLKSIPGDKTDKRDSSRISKFLFVGLLKGQEDVAELVKFRHGKMKASPEELAVALNGKLTSHHGFMLRIIKQSIVDKEGLIEELDKEIDRLLEENEMAHDAELLSSIQGPVIRLLKTKC